MLCSSTMLPQPLPPTAASALTAPPAQLSHPTHDVSTGPPSTHATMGAHPVTANTPSRCATTAEMAQAQPSCRKPSTVVRQMPMTGRMLLLQLL